MEDTRHRRLYASTEPNFCENLVHDMEALREALGIGRWLLFGGSWGATLALAYTRGASQIFPQALHAFATALGPLGSIDPQQLLPAYDRQLHRNDAAQAQAAALAWCGWEDAISSAHTAPRREALDPHHSLAMARISTHLFLRDPWLGAWDQVWPAQNLQGIPGTIMKGQWDVVTPVVTAWQLHQRCPGSTLRIVPEAGHASSDPALRQALIKAMDDRADRAEMTMNEAEISNSI